MALLERIQHPNHLVTYRSPRLHAAGVPHGFSTRVGGVSTGPYASLNLGPLAKGEESDHNTAVAENFRRLRGALHLRQHLRVECKQVHGAGVWHPPVEPMRPADCPEADAMVTDLGHRLLTIRTADCVPVLLATSDGKWVGAAHAGWRGVVAGVVHAAVVALAQRADVSPTDLIAAVGPGIGVDYFEVGEEVARAFEGAGLGAAVRRDRGPRPHVDLPAAVKLQLIHSHVPEVQVDATDRCTFRDEAEFFSHRRDHGTTGRMAAVIATSSQ